VAGDPATTFDPSSFPDGTTSVDVVAIFTPVVGVLNSGTVGSGGTTVNPVKPVGSCPVTAMASGSGAAGGTGGGAGGTSGAAGGIGIASATIPTMGEWALMIFALLILNLGLIFIKRQELSLAGIKNRSL